MSCSKARSKELSEDFRLDERLSSSSVIKIPDVVDVIKVNVQVKKCSMLALRAEIRKIAYNMESILSVGLSCLRLLENHCLNLC